ncbi:hypothetical protein P389DRAFT_151253 [Cystobasidium minutum MCA 4210]|uniref:uncharacterized protein n=1 Tax=Cystobasidium minutum MCA 4210 TaxID=1397322 RepID=UPI0034CD14C2|eukprot:jgi/Rhomi1/151253/estExt_Genewise1.C_3_t20022
MATILAGTAAVLGAGVAMRAGLRSAARNGAKLSPLMQKIAGQTGPSGPSSRFGRAPNGQEWVLGGFQARMDRREASQILGLRERDLTKNKIKDAHRRVMLANHPDRGGSPYLSSKINEAKDMLDKQVRNFSTSAYPRR